MNKIILKTIKIAQMENLTIHNRINFKSHYPPSGFFRIKRVGHYRHDATKGNYKSFDIPFYPELQRFCPNVFRSKF